MVQRCDFDEQPTLTGDNGRQRPDLIVHLPGGKQIVVDAKAPLEAFLDAQDAADDDVRTTRLRAHARQVRDHMDKLGGKAYWEPLGGSPELVVMFLPGETLFSAALQHDLELIEGSYIRYFTLTYALKLTERHFMEQFRRMLISKLRVVFETANGEVEMWNKAASSQIDAQLRDRRHDFRRRHDALERIQSAAGDLEQRLAELEAQDQRLQQEAARCSELLDAVRAQVTAGAALKPIDATPTLKQA